MRRPGAVGIVALAAILSVAFSFSGCSRDAAGTPAEQLSTWISGTGFVGSTALIRSDLDRAAEVVRTSADPKVNHTVCGVLLVDLEQANQNLPTPDTQTSQLLGAAYESLGAAAHDCYDAAGSVSKQVSFSKDRAAGLMSLTAAELRMAVVLGHPVTTSTTAGG